jgi:hypothetical protein
MKPAYLVGSLLTFTVGVGAALGINAYLSAKSELASVKAAVQTTTAQPTQPAQTAQATQVAATVQSAPIGDFESLSLCDQMDAIAKSGKSVAQFIADSERYDEFEANVKANCNWNTEQLNQAYAILNPPVITIQPRIVERPIVERPIVVNPPQPVPSKPIPGKSWNNCNGIPEPGETYSPACDDAQTNNDLNPDPHHHDPIDNRPIDPKTGERTDPDLPFDPHTGKNTGVKGYLVLPEDSAVPEVSQPQQPALPEASQPAEPETVEITSDAAESEV